MIESERKQIIDLIRKEVIPAIGCTEPIAVALCVAKAAETLNMKPEKIEVLLSANILKNAMGVGIPGTDMVGLPIAVALGALIGKSEYQLEVLRDCRPEAVEEGKQFIAEKRICISLKAVSYTHLDVYKRQGICMRGGPIVGPPIPLFLSKTTSRRISYSMPPTSRPNVNLLK